MLDGMQAATVGGLIRLSQSEASHLYVNINGGGLGVVSGVFKTFRMDINQPHCIRLELKKSLDEVGDRRREFVTLAY
jgi:hypothetical protein